MIRVVRSNLITSDAHGLVNAVNTQGVMGKGIALLFKRAFPDNYEAYREVCRKGQLEVGSVFEFQTRGRWILNVPTKKHWVHDSSLEYIKLAAAALAKSITKLNLRSVAVPALGCGAGNLAWSDVEPVLTAELGGLGEVDVRLHAPLL